MGARSIVPFGQESGGQQPCPNYRGQDNHDEGRHKAPYQEEGHGDRYRKQHRPHQSRKPCHSVLIQHCSFLRTDAGLEQQHVRH